MTNILILFCLDLKKEKILHIKVVNSCLLEAFPFIIIDDFFNIFHFNFLFPLLFSLFIYEKLNFPVMLVALSSFLLVTCLSLKANDFLYVRNLVHHYNHYFHK